MDMKIAGLIGAVAALTGAGPSQAAPTPAPITVDNLMEVSSYADLLAPIPNAVALLAESDAKADFELASNFGGGATVQEAQYYYHDHHHHHHRSYRSFYRHHHHHNNYYRRPRHHHHHNSYYRY